MKILVVGFPRSGTTLMYRIFKTHPQVEKMYFEKWLLKHPEKTKNNIEFKKGHTFGSKVIYAKRVIGKIGKTKYNIVDYCNDWNKRFKDEARIIQIIRYPLDSLNSLVISKKKHPIGPGATTVYKEYLKYISKYSLDIAALDNCLTIKYEDLVTNPDKVIPRLYKHCNIKNVKFKEKMKIKRVFNHENKKFLLPWDDRLKNVVNVFNTLPGIRYEIKEK